MSLYSYLTAGLCIASASLFFYLRRRKKYRLADFPQFAAVDKPPPDPVKLEQFSIRRDAIVGSPLLDPTKSPRGADVSLVKVESRYASHLSCSWVFVNKLI